jgi:hypothetical protein
MRRYECWPWFRDATLPNTTKAAEEGAGHSRSSAFQNPDLVIVAEKAV